jgi:hypothetical protein
VATAWMEFKPLLFRDQDTTVKGIDQLRQQLPFSLLGVDTDNGIGDNLSNFWNRQVHLFN